MGCPGLASIFSDVQVALYIDQISVFRGSERGCDDSGYALGQGQFFPNSAAIRRLFEIGSIADPSRLSVRKGHYTARTAGAFFCFYPGFAAVRAQSGFSYAALPDRIDINYVKCVASGTAAVSLGPIFTAICCDGSLACISRPSRNAEGFGLEGGCSQLRS